MEPTDAELAEAGEEFVRKHAMKVATVNPPTPTSSRTSAMKRPASAAASEALSKAPKKAKGNKKSAEEKEAEALKKRQEAPAPWGRCGQEDCQAPLRIVPRLHGGRPSVACPRYRSGLCRGWMRQVRDDEVDKLAEKLFRRVQLD